MCAHTNESKYHTKLPSPSKLLTSTKTQFTADSRPLLVEPTARASVPVLCICACLYAYI